MTTRIDAQGARRSVTDPTRLQRAPSLNKGDTTTPLEDKAETLYVHPAVKVVSFAASPGPGKALANAGRWHSQNTEGTLPWASRSERVMAVGMCHRILICLPMR